MNLSTVLDAVARRHPDRPAVTWESAHGGQAATSYRAFACEVARIAGGLAGDHGLAPGTRVGIVMENAPEYFPLLYGIWRAGLTAVPINARLHPREMAWILADADARLAVVSPEIAGRMSALADVEWPRVVVTGTREHAALLAAEAYAGALPADPAAEAWLFYTSGTTGRPKGAVLTHANLLFMIHAYLADIDFLGPGDTMVHAAPLSHGAGLYGLAHFARGANNVILAGSFDPARVLAAFRDFPAVSMFAAPTMVVRLLDHPAAGSADTRRLKTIVYGGAPMYVADLRRGLEMLGPRFYQVYGQGESPMTITGLDKADHADVRHPRHLERLGSAGTARTGCAVRIVDEAGRALPAGEVGEIVTRSDCVMAGYWRNREANAKALRDGWLWTGDLGAIDADGYLTLKDRSKDMIISGGSNIYPREIEEVLLTHPGVLECAVVSRPHAEWGEEVIAFVVARPGACVDAAALDRLCLDNIARYKRPRGYRFVAALAKNNYGKVLKTALREVLRRETAG